MSFEEENQKKRERDGRHKNVIKWYTAKESDEVFYVGDLEMQDPYGDGHVYTPSKKQLEDMEAKERAAMGQVDQDFEASEDSEPLSEQTAESTSDSSSGEMTEEERIANEIYQRLMAEAAADERAKQAEIDALRAQQEATSDDYNEATGSYSGLYGKKPMSESEADALQSIMNQNSSYTKSIEDLIKENQES